jgi:hypothetical protein
MHTTLKQHPGFDLPQTMRGMRRIRAGDGADVDGDDVGVVDVMEILPPTPRRSRWCRWW